MEGLWARGYELSTATGLVGNEAVKSTYIVESQRVFTQVFLHVQSSTPLVHAPRSRVRSQRRANFLLFFFFFFCFVSSVFHQLQVLSSNPGVSILFFFYLVFVSFLILYCVYFMFCFILFSKFYFFICVVFFLVKLKFMYYFSLF